MEGVAESPADRLHRLGGEALTDEELLALVLAPGARSGAVLDSARDLLKAAGSLRRLSTRCARELASSSGVGPVQAARLQAVFALGRRLMERRMRPGTPFLSPRQVFEHYHAVLRDRKKERFLVVLLDARHRLLREEMVSEGSLTSSIVHPREVFLPAVRESAGAVVLVHNHPSGDPSPSDEDVAITRRLLRASELLGIRVLDHVIVGDGSYASFKESGLL
ncbi:MAG: DNA repair protein RadC [Planctomycetota bacterium]